MSPEELSQIRKDYSKLHLNEEDVAPSPIHQFGKWWNEAAAAEILEMNAMALATAGKDGVVDARTVLLKNIN